MAWIATARLTIDGDVFHTQSKNGYFFVFIAADSTQNLGNIDRVQLQGIDLEFNARLTNHLQVDAGFGYTDSEIKKFPDPIVVGAKAPLVADYTFNIGAQYTTPLWGDVEGIARIDYNRIGPEVFTIRLSGVTSSDEMSNLIIRMNTAPPHAACTAFFALPDDAIP